MPHHLLCSLNMRYWACPLRWEFVWFEILPKNSMQVTKRSPNSIYIVQLFIIWVQVVMGGLLIILKTAYIALDKVNDSEIVSA